MSMDREKYLLGLLEANPNGISKNELFGKLTTRMGLSHATVYNLFRSYLGVGWMREIDRPRARGGKIVLLTAEGLEEFKKLRGDGT